MRKSLLLLCVCLVFISGCQKHPQISYASLDSSGMWSTSLDEVKKLNVTEAEIIQLTKLKQASATDDLCLELLKAARAHHHEFSSADSAIRLSSAGYSDQQILEMANSDQIDILGGEAITLKLIGLSSPTVQEILHRRMQGLPTLSSAQVGRLKNTAMSERQILELMSKGFSDQQIETLIRQREAARDHSNTGFVRQNGRKH